MNTLGERVKYVLKNRSVKVIDVAASMDKKQTTISNYMTNRAYPNGDFFIALKQFVPDLDLNWLITGKGEAFLKENDSNGSLVSLKKELKESQSRERELTNALLKVIGGKTPVAKNKGVYVPANLMLHNNRVWFGAKHTVNYTPRFAQ